MKRILTIGLVTASFLSYAGIEREAVFQLDTSKTELRALTPVVIYLANDIQSPVNATRLEQSVRYLEKGLVGKQFFLDTGKAFSEGDLDSFAQLSKTDQAFLSQVADWLKSDVSPRGPANVSQALRNGICRKNPKYRSALVVVRNLFMPGILKKKEREKVRIDYCGPDLKASISHDTAIDVNEAGEGVFDYPYSEQALTHLGFVKAVFNQIAVLYPPSKHRYLVYVYSAAAPGYVMSPQMPTVGVGLPIQKVRKAILDRKASFLNAEGKIKTDRSFFLALQAALQSVDSATPKWGVSTEQFLDLLNEIPDLRAPVVLLDTNGQDFSKLEKLKLDGLGSVFYTENPAPEDIANDLNPLFYFVGVKAKDLEDRLRQLFGHK